MAATSFAIRRGVDGFAINSFTQGTTAPATLDIQLCVNNLDANSHAVTRKDIVIACMAFIRAVESGHIFTTAPPL